MAEKKVEPVAGAARYVAFMKGVWMFEENKLTEGTLIQSCTNQERAEKAAVKWQQKENAAVIKEKKNG